MNIILFEDLEKENPLPIEDPRSQHIIKVLKLRTGDSFTAGCIPGLYGTGKIQQISKKVLTFSFTLKEDPKVPAPIHLLIGHPRPIFAKRMLKDLTSLGVSSLIFTSAELGEKSYLSSKLWKEQGYQEFLIQGAQQAGTSYIPEVSVQYSLEKSVSLLPDRGTRICLHPGKEYPLLAEKELLQWEPVSIAIGPERGWTENEAEALREKGFSMVQMGERILKTETACTTAVSAVLVKRGLL
ncbi:MAG: 16S rRNA (uracil(1498)-N(3))-methyltransferase [Spirochaetia bacterium]